MQEPPKAPFSSEYEARRLEALQSYRVLDTPPDALFDDLVEIAAYICDAPIAVVNFIDRDRQWFKAVKGLGVRETGLDVSICRQALLQPGVFVVPDLAKNPLFMANPLVDGEAHLRFYAGALIESDDGYPLGTVCVLDTKPRDMSEAQKNALQALAHQAMGNLELLRANHRQAELLAELEKARAQLSEQAATDALTGLFNRRAFDERLEQELAQMQRGGESASLMMMDLDHFKRINDETGHYNGDLILSRFAEQCRHSFRQGDTIARWGGEEFMVLLPDTDPREAEAVALRLQQNVRQQPITVEAQQTPLTVSIGIVSLEG